MKWLFLLLFIINATVFSLAYQHDQTEKQPEVEAGGDVGDMRLISELSEEEKQEIAQADSKLDGDVLITKADQPAEEHASVSEDKGDQTETVETKVVKETPAVEKTVEKVKESKPETVTKAESKTKTINETEAKAESKTKTINETVAKAESKTKTINETVAKAESITKAKKETEAKIEKAKKEQVASLDKQPKKPSLDKKPKESKNMEKKLGTERRCGVIGPLKDRKVAKEAVEELRNSELEAKLERHIEKEQIGYWVVIPPMEDGSQAQAKIEELAQVGVEDIWHFRGGGLKNAISLGMFAKKENAESFSEDVLKKGFKTEMRPRYLNKTRYFVKFTIEKPKNVTENMWHDVEKRYSKMPFKEQSCESIATK